jgi:hypothetical protein
MPTTGQYFLNASTLAAATAVFTDSALLTKATDGYYKQGTTVRQQVGGFLQAQSTCPTCGTEATLCYSTGLTDVCCNCA